MLSSIVKLVPKVASSDSAAVLSPWFVTDLRDLNSKNIQRNLPLALCKETMQAIGQGEPQRLLVLDLKQSYHCLRCQMSKLPWNNIILCPSRNIISILKPSEENGLNFFPATVKLLRPKLIYIGH